MLYQTCFFAVNFQIIRNINYIFSICGMMVNKTIKCYNTHLLQRTKDAWISCMVEDFESETQYPRFEVNMEDHMLKNSIKFGKPKFALFSEEPPKYAKGYWVSKREHASPTRTYPSHDAAYTSELNSM